MPSQKTKKSKKKKIILWSVIGSIFIILLLLIMTSSEETIISVQTEKVEKRNITQLVTATGKIKPVNQVVLRPEVSGEIVSLPIKEGDRVKKGQLLLQIKSETYRAQVNKAAANLEYAKANLKIRLASLDQIRNEYERMKGLFEKGLASDAEYENAKANFLSAEGQYEAQQSAVLQAEESLREMREQLAKTTIRSPMDGVITSLKVEPNERVLGSNFSVGTELMTVANLNEMEATVEVDENDVVLISIGDTTKIKVDAFGDREFLGKVTEIGNSAIASGYGTQDQVINFEVKILLLNADERVRPGMSCDADIMTETKNNVVSVPLQSVTARMPDQLKLDEKKDSSNNVIQENDKKKSNKPIEIVFINQNGIATAVPVVTGISDDNFIEVISGLDGTEEVITGPYRSISKELEDGSKISIQKGKKGKTEENKEE
ncbi:MAG: efflux RND transporter periplasmic adaptor subunit [Ignavibacteriales bacterium]|nr:efflux RND transporter periplasmic adaptor subunit [Ignavibacteriales bacterium]